MIYGQVAEAVLKIGKEKLRVVSGNVGGAFGMKIFLHPEQPLVVWASRRLKRAVRWTADRSESFVSDVQGRDNYSVAELALDSRRAFPRAARDDLGQHGRVPVELRALHPAARGADALRRVPHSGDLRQHQGRRHQHRAGGCLPRRGAARGDLPARAGDRPGRARAGSRPRRASPPQLHQIFRHALPDAGREPLRLGRFRR